MLMRREWGGREKKAIMMIWSSVLILLQLMRLPETAQTSWGLIVRNSILISSPLVFSSPFRIYLQIPRHKVFGALRASEEV